MLLKYDQTLPGATTRPASYQGLGTGFIIQYTQNANVQQVRQEREREREKEREREREREKKKKRKEKKRKKKKKEKRGVCTR